MAILTKPVKSFTPRVSGALIRFRNVLIGLMIAGFGISFGYLLSSSRETAELTLSIVVILIVLPLIIHKPLNGLLLLVLFTAFIEKWVEIPLGAGIPDLSFSRFVIAFMGISMLAQAAVGRFRFAPLGLVDACIIATTLGIMSAAFLSVRPTNTVQVAISMHLTPLLMYFFAKNLVQDKSDLHKILWAVALFGFVAAAYAIYEATTGHILFLDRDEVASELRTNLTENLRLLQGLLGLSANFGRVFLSSIPVTLYLIFESKKANRQIGLAGMLAIQFLAMFLTYNRTSWYALMISLFVLQFFYPQFRKLYLVMVFIAVIVLWASWDQVNQSVIVQERLSGQETDTADFNGRTPRWQAGFNMWQAKPIRGWGFGRFEEESGRFRTDGIRKNFYAFENDFLRILVGSGLIGFLPYFLFLFVPLINSVRLFFRVRAPDWTGFIKSETIAIYWVIILGFVIGSYTQTLNQVIVKILPFVIAGAVVGTQQHWLSTSKRSKDTATFQGL